jgi:hypothetical protein
MDVKSTHTSKGSTNSSNDTSKLGDDIADAEVESSRNKIRLEQNHLVP